MNIRARLRKKKQSATSMLAACVCKATNATASWFKQSQAEHKRGIHELLWQQDSLLLASSVQHASRESSVNFLLISFKWNMWATWNQNEFLHSVNVSEFCIRDSRWSEATTVTPVYVFFHSCLTSVHLENVKTTYSFTIQTQSSLLWFIVASYSPMIFCT